MNHFDMNEYSRLLWQLQYHECWASTLQGHPLIDQGAQVRDAALKLFADTEKLTEQLGFQDAYDIAAMTRMRVAAAMSDAVDLSALEVEIRHVKDALVKESFYRHFLHIEKDRLEFLDENQLFGTDVADKFGSSSRDLKEAGNCLATECGTACVFHLMRAAEFALRALAKDRGVSFSDRPLEEKEWGQILGNLEARIKDLRDAPRSSWTRSERREEQIRFYSEVVQELRGFNDAWRRHVSHADPLAFYERDAALGILKHVRSFMQKLATKISETSFTDTFWP